MTSLDELLAMIVDSEMRDDAREKYFERCAIVEFDGKMSRMEAEALALRELREKVERK